MFAGDVTVDAVEAALPDRLENDVVRELPLRRERRRKNRGPPDRERRERLLELFRPLLRHAVLRRKRRQSGGNDLPRRGAAAPGQQQRQQQDRRQNSHLVQKNPEFMDTRNIIYHARPDFTTCRQARAT